MSVNHQGPAIRLLITIALATLGGCTNRYYFEDFRGKYVSPEVPTQFASNGRKNWQVSGGLAWGMDGRLMDFSLQDTIWSAKGRNGTYFDRPPDSSSDSLLQERYRFDQQPASAYLDLTYLRAHWYAGISLGTGIPDLCGAYLGAFVGYSQLLLNGHLVPTFGLGVYLNRIQVEGRYWHTGLIILPASNDGTGTGSPLLPDLFSKDSVRSRITNVEWPLKLGLMYRPSNAFEPYVLVKDNLLVLWPIGTQDPGRYTVDDGGLVLGIRNESVPGMALSVELFLEVADGPLGNSTDGATVSFRLQHQL